VEQIDTCAGSPSFLFNRVEDGTSGAKVQRSQQLTYLVVLERVKGSHLKVDKATVSISRNENDGIRNRCKDRASQPRWSPIRWRFPV
jgi:hypothetical protein